MLGYGYVQGGLLPFYETKAPQAQHGYLKVLPGVARPLNTQRLESRYAVLTRYLDLPRRLNLLGATVAIRDNRDGSLLASATYVLDRESGAYCGPPGAGFSTAAFVEKVLQLARH